MAACRAIRSKPAEQVHAQHFHEHKLSSMLHHAHLCQVRHVQTCYQRQLLLPHQCSNLRPHKRSPSLSSRLGTSCGVHATQLESHASKRVVQTGAMAAKWQHQLSRHRDGGLLSEQTQRSSKAALGSEGCNRMRHPCTHIIKSIAILPCLLQHAHAECAGMVVNSIHIASCSSSSSSSSSRQDHQLLVWLSQHVVK